MWALAELNHLPPDGAVSAILERFTKLCQLLRQEPNLFKRTRAKFV